MRIAIQTFGCRLNQAEADVFAAEFAAQGWTVVAEDRDADVVVIHSCAVTRTAEQKCLRLCRRLAGRAPRPFVVLSGCVPEASSDASARAALAAAGAALIIPREARDELVACVTRAVLAELGPSDFPSPARTPPVAPRHRRPFLKVQDGCDFCCTYCIVPRTRGGPVSRPFDACIREAEAHAAAGAREIVIAGCNTACYADAGRRLPDLLRALAGIPGLGRIRIGSIEPGTVERELADLMARTPALCRHLHVPAQSGDDDILRAMGRRVTAADYRAAAEYALARVPGLGLGTDIITGFPGETDARFENTRRLVESLPFSNLHVFPYSERPGTPAARLPNPVPPGVRKARAAELIRIGVEQRGRFARSFLGMPVTCLVERFDADGAACGWSGAYLPCRVAGVDRAALGDLVTFTPTAAEDHTLIGKALT
jgi:threonylcarbamoyladenosine tRNA methylthiotransferase MtaB